MVNQGNAIPSKELGVSNIIAEPGIPEFINNVQIHELKFDKEDYLYISSDSCIWIYDRVKWHRIYTPAPVRLTIPDSSGLLVSSSKEVFALARDGKNNFYLHTIYHTNNEYDILERTFFLNKNLILKFNNRISYLDKNGEHLIDSLTPGTSVFPLRDNTLLYSSENDKRFVKLNINETKPFYLRWPAFIIYGVALFILIFIAYKRINLIRLWINGKENDAVEIKAFHREEPGEAVNEAKIEPGKKMAGRKAKWDKYQMVTVLFSDIQGFTKIAEQMNPEKLIDELDKFFFHFDSVVEKYNIEKIKTIGDAYMAAGGIPKKNRANPVEVVLAALEMQQYMHHLKKTKVDFWDLRIGVHTGPVIAGVIGQKKRSYDIWGDTVNTASRMESSGEAGKVNISGETYQLVREYFICEYRGKLPVKYKGNLDMYFVTGLRPELSINLEGLPNRKFFLKLQLLRLADLEEYVFDKLEEETPGSFYFHNSSYAKQMYNYAGLLAKAENLDVEETLLIRTAILVLPLGYLSNYLNPELEASKNSPQVLSEFKYSDEQVQKISNLILASKYPPEPLSHLEKVMVDIRYEYLGRVDYPDMQKLLFREKSEHGEINKSLKWKDQQVSLLQSFSYFTPGARRLSEVSFDRQIERLKNDNRLQ